MTDATPALAELTTIRVGGVPERLVVADDRAALVDAVLEARDAAEDWLLLGGGSNTVASDDGFDGTVIHIRSRGIERLDAPEGRIRLRVEAGEPWDDVVAFTVRHGWSGVEADGGADDDGLGGHGVSFGWVVRLVWVTRWRRRC